MTFQTSHPALVHPNLVALLDTMKAEDSLTPAERLAEVERLAKDTAEYVERHTRKTDVGPHITLTDDVVLAAARAELDEWEGSFQMLADVVLRTAGDDPSADTVIEIVVPARGNAKHMRGRYTGVYASHDDGTVTLTTGDTYDREEIIAIGMH